MAKVSQWLSSRSSISGWPTDRKTEHGRMASLEYQSQPYAAHPLLFGLVRNAVGFIRPLSMNPLLTRFTNYQDQEDDLRYDALATEDGFVIVDEDTGEPLAAEVDATPKPFSGSSYLLIPGV